MDQDLDVERLRERIGTPWGPVAVVQETGSTNADLAAAGRAGTATAGAVLVTELQVAGRGPAGPRMARPARPGPDVLGRSSSRACRPPAGAGFRCSPGSPSWTPYARWPTYPSGSSGPTTCWRRTAASSAGILVERVDAALAVVGIGINVRQSSVELPVEAATSLALVTGRPVDRGDLLVAVLR